MPNRKNTAPTWNRERPAIFPTLDETAQDHLRERRLCDAQEIARRVEREWSLEGA